MKYLKEIHKGKVPSKGKGRRKNVVFLTQFYPAIERVLLWKGTSKTQELLIQIILHGEELEGESNALESSCRLD